MTEDERQRLLNEARNWENAREAANGAAEKAGVRPPIPARPVTQAPTPPPPPPPSPPPKAPE